MRGYWSRLRVLSIHGLFIAIALLLSLIPDVKFTHALFVVYIIGGTLTIVIAVTLQVLEDIKRSKKK